MGCVANGNNINARQIKAARALLDWSQDQLAEASGLSVATIRKIEAGSISPRTSTNDQMLLAFEAAGLEFMPNDGLRRKPEDISVFHGHDGAVAFFDDVYQTINKSGGEIVVVVVSEQSFVNALGDYAETHMGRMRRLGDKVSVKCIIMEDLEETPADYCEYRSISKNFVDCVPFYIYGDNYAIFLFEAVPSPKIIVHRSPLLANAYRRQFHSIWKKATVLQPVTVSKAVGRDKK